MARQSLTATLSVLRIINIRALRRHLGRALLAAVSLGGGVAIVVAVMIETSSVRTAIDDVGYRIAGPTPLRIVGEATLGSIGPAVLNTAGKVHGVATLVPIIRATTLVRDHGRETTVLALGIDCSAHWIIDPKVCRPGQREPQILATSTTLGRTWSAAATLATDIGQLPLQRLAQIPQLDTINNGRVVLLPLSAAQTQFARAKQVDTVYVTVDKNASVPDVHARLVTALSELGPGYRVLTPADPAAAFDVNAILLPMLGIFALIAVGVGVILIAQLTRLSVEERRRDTAVAAALGATPLSVLAGFLAEAAALGAAGSVIGIVLGVLIANPVVASASDLTQRFMGVNVPVVVEPGVVLLGLAMGVLLAVLAAVVPSVSASRTAIATELSGRAAHEQSASRSIWRKAAALLAVGILGALGVRLATISGGLTPAQADFANVGTVVAVVGFLLAAAYVSAQIVAVIRIPPDRKRWATPAVALTGLRSDLSRTAAIAGAVAVPVAVATLLSGFLVAIDQGVANVAHAQAESRLVVTTTRFTDWGAIDARFADSTITKLSAVPGVGAIERLSEIEITLPNGSLAYVRAEDRPTFSFPVLAGQGPQTSLDDGRLVIGGILARENGIRVGDTILLGSGPRARRMVVGSIVATPEVGGRRIQMRYPMAELIFGAQPANLVFVKPAAPPLLDGIAADIRSAHFEQSVKVVDAQGYRTAVVAGESRFLTPLNTLKYGLLAIAFVSVFSTLLLLGIRRRREVALIQALGATPAKVFAITTFEAVIASAVGAFAGGLLAVAITDTVRRAAVVDVGSVTPLIFPFGEAVLYSFLAIVAAVLAAVIPAWRNTQAAPASELRDQ